MKKELKHRMFLRCGMCTRVKLPNTFKMFTSIVHKCQIAVFTSEPEKNEDNRVGFFVLAV